MTGQRDGQHGNTERSYMLRDADARFRWIGLRQIGVLLRPVRRKDEFILVGRAAVNHDDRHVGDRNIYRREQPAVNIPAE